MCATNLVAPAFVARSTLLPPIQDGLKRNLDVSLAELHRESRKHAVICTLSFPVELSSGIPPLSAIVSDKLIMKEEALMRSQMKSACLGMILIASCLAQSPPSSEKGAISGSVTSVSGEPLRRVTVRLTPLPAARGSSVEVPVSNATAETDSSGNFTFDEVAPGRYILQAERTGFLNAGYSNARGPVLTINPGQKTTDIVIQMTPQGIIAGRVVDDEKESLPGVTVRLYSALGQRQRFELPGGTATTDADGAFAIGGLFPGRYVVSVAAPPSAASPVKSSSLQSHQDIYVTTYYPDATDLAAATPVELSAGAQVRGLEIRLQRVPVFKVSGKVVNAATGEAGSADVLNLIRQGSGAPGLSAQSTGLKAGEFSFDGVLPGTYILETKPTAEIDDHPPLVVWQTISVGNGDLDRVVVEMKPAIELRGHIIVEGKPPPSWPQITLVPADGLNYLDSPMIDVDGSFVLTGLEPAPYRVTVSSIPPPMFVKSVRFNGHDLSGDIDLASAPTASLEIVISHGTSSISGVVSDSDGPVGPAVNVMATGPHGGWAQTDEHGRFSFAGLPPGEYLLIAMDTGPGMLPPESLIRLLHFEKLGKAVTVGDGNSATADLRLTTRDDFRRAADLR